MTHQIDGVFGNLLSEFAGGAKNQGAWIGGFDMTGVCGVFAALFFGGFFTARCSLCDLVSPGLVFVFFLLLLLLQQGVQHRQQKRCGLATARLARDQ